uniref:Uncharacterized protein n=1 Tax=Ixodes ricinus TaxID=34613 RepID=A0A6B0V972_IXORI
MTLSQGILAAMAAASSPSAASRSTGLSGAGSSLSTPGLSSPLTSARSLVSLRSETALTLRRDLMLSVLLSPPSSSSSANVEERARDLRSPGFFSLRLQRLKLELWPAQEPPALRSRWGRPWAMRRPRFSSGRTSSSGTLTVLLLLFSDSPSASASCSTKLILLSPTTTGWVCSASETRLWAEVWLTPRVLRAMLQRRLAFTLRGSIGGRSRVDVRRPALWGSSWYVSRRNAVTSSSSWHAAIFRANGHPLPAGSMLASSRKSSSSSSILHWRRFCSSAARAASSRGSNTSLWSISSSLAPMASAHWKKSFPAAL